MRGPGRRERRFEVLAVGRCPALVFSSFRCPLAGKRRRDAGEGVPACELVSVGGGLGRVRAMGVRVER